MPHSRDVLLDLVRLFVDAILVLQLQLENLQPSRQEIPPDIMPTGGERLISLDAEDIVDGPGREEDSLPRLEDHVAPFVSGGGVRLAVWIRHPFGVFFVGGTGQPAEAERSLVDLDPGVEGVGVLMGRCEVPAFGEESPVCDVGPFSPVLGCCCDTGAEALTEDVVFYPVQELELNVA